MNDSTASMTSEEDIISGLPRIANMGDIAGSRRAPKDDSLKVLNRLVSKSNRNPKQQLAPKIQKIIQNNGGNPSILQNIPSSPPTYPVHYAESIEELNLEFLGKLQESRLW